MASVSNVSVIVPNYNHACFLDQRLNSILNQSYPNYEIIILDDCSSDDSREIINRYKDNPKISCIIFNDSNSGNPFFQWKKGIEAAKNELIWVAESDDYAAETFLEILVAKLDQFPKAALAYCQSNKVDPENINYGPLYWWTDDLDNNRWLHDYTNVGTNECKFYLLHKNTIPNASAVLVRKDVILNALIEMTPMKLCGDWQIWVRILLKNDIAFSKQCLNFFRFHGLSVRKNTSWLHRASEQTKVVKLICKQTHPDPKIIRAIIYSLTKESIVHFIQFKWNRMLFGMLLNLFVIDPKIYIIVLKDGVYNKLKKYFRPTPTL